MTLKPLIPLLLLLAAAPAGRCQKQADKNTRKIALVAPLYLDSVFRNNSYQYSKKFPRFALQGLDFVQGARIALDSFPLAEGHTELYLFDTRADSPTLRQRLERNEFDDMDLILGAVKDEALGPLAELSQRKHIPFVSATYPNDGGITRTPGLILLNATLRTHCEAIFSYLLQNQSQNRILLVRKTGPQEERVAGYFQQINRPDNKNLLPIKPLVLDSNYAILKSQLDSTRTNVVIVGSLDETFASDIATQLSMVRKKYDILLIGMPNWDGFSAFGRTLKPAFKDFPIHFTSTYYHEKNDRFSETLTNGYLNVYKGKPSEYSFRGFEAMYLFLRLIHQYPQDLTEHLNDPRPRVFTDFRFLPVGSDPARTADYQENRQIYFLKKKNGITEKAW